MTPPFGIDDVLGLVAASTTLEVVFVEPLDVARVVVKSKLLN
jgi:hypothetical protein